MKNLWMFALVIGLIAGSCKKEEEEKILGCTNSTASNYNAEANTDDGSCTYISRLSFWQDYANSQSLSAIGPQIQFHIDGILTGYIQTSPYNSVEPPCGNGIHVHGVVLPNSNTASVQYDLRYYDNASSSWVVFQSGTVSAAPGGCNSIQIVY